VTREKGFFAMNMKLERLTGGVVSRSNFNFAADGPDGRIGRVSPQN
jgi:hypothetical protein